MTRVVVIAGTCGTGKSTVGEKVATLFSCDFIEGDKLHPKENIEKMSHGIPLQDEDRWDWLTTVSNHSADSARANKGQVSVITCSSLKLKYRDHIRSHNPDVEYLFVFLYATKEQLIKRTLARKGHYMKVDMVESQISTLELPKPDEKGTTIIDVDDKQVDEVVELTMSYINSNKS